MDTLIFVRLKLTTQEDAYAMTARAKANVETNRELMLKVMVQGGLGVAATYFYLAIQRENNQRRVRKLIGNSAWVARAISAYMVADLPRAFRLGECKTVIHHLVTLGMAAAWLAKHAQTRRDLAQGTLFVKAGMLAIMTEVNTTCYHAMRAAKTNGDGKGARFYAAMTIATIPTFRVLNWLHALHLMYTYLKNDSNKKCQGSLCMLIGSFAIAAASSYYTPVFYFSAVRAFTHS